MSIWSTAQDMAAQTPPERNRYVDFLRAVSILVVVMGHWLIAGFMVVGDQIETVKILAELPKTQWLTWLFQVMPIFFIVGGYSNAVSLESADRKNQGFSDWLSGRLDRLIRPLLPLIGFWVLLTIAMSFMGVESSNLQLITQLALIPIWFLAIYTMVVLFAPLTYRAWQALGMWSVTGFVALAVLVDLAVFVGDISVAGWTNYLWIWLAVHQLGYAWRAGRFNGSIRSVAVSVVAWASLAAMVHFGPYPLAMVGSPDEDMSNTLPPKLPLLALGIAQFSMLMVLESRINRWLNRLNVWAATVLINSMIMTLYLWHITIMLLCVVILWKTGGFGLSIEPGVTNWWLTRPIWIVLLFAMLLPVTLLLSPVERSLRPETRKANAARQVIGAVMVCLGIALMAMFGLANPPIAYMNVGAVLLIFCGAMLSGVMGLGRGRAKLF